MSNPFYNASGVPADLTRGLPSVIRNEFSAIGSGFDAVDTILDQVKQIGVGTYSATSTTSLTIGTGSKSLTVETGKSFVVGQPVMIASTAGPTNYMIGQVTAYDSGTGAMTVNVTSTQGSGTVAAWTVSVTSVLSASNRTIKYQVFTSSGTWVQPSDVTANDIVKVLLISGGGGGGAGGAALLMSANPNFAAGARGGSGGGSGFGIVLDILLGTAPGTAHSVVVGAGGNGGTAVTCSTYTSPATGNSGTAGGTSSFGAYSFASVGGGQPGLGGTGSYTASGGSVPHYLGSQSNVGSGGAYGVGIKPYVAGTVPDWNSVYLGDQYFYEVSENGMTTSHVVRNRALGSSIGGSLPGSVIQASTNGITVSYSAQSPSKKSTVYNWDDTTFFGVNVSRTGGAGANGGHISRDGSSVLNQGGNVTGTASAGANAAGYGSGGAGGGGCVNSSGSATSGAGGNGSPGVVVVVWESAI